MVVSRCQVHVWSFSENINSHVYLCCWHVKKSTVDHWAWQRQGGWVPFGCWALWRQSGWVPLKHWAWQGKVAESLLSVGCYGGKVAEFLLSIGHHGGKVSEFLSYAEPDGGSDQDLSYLRRPNEAEQNSSCGRYSVTQMASIPVTCKSTPYTLGVVDIKMGLQP